MTWAAQNTNCCNNVVWTSPQCRGVAAPIIRCCCDFVYLLGVWRIFLCECVCVCVGGGGGGGGIFIFVLYSLHLWDAVLYNKVLFFFFFFFCLPGIFWKTGKNLLTKRVIRKQIPVCFYEHQASTEKDLLKTEISYSHIHYENTPIQIYWKLFHQKMKIFR